MVSFQAFKFCQTPFWTTIVNRSFWSKLKQILILAKCSDTIFSVIAWQNLWTAPRFCNLYCFVQRCCCHLRLFLALTNSLWSPYFMPLILVCADRGRNSYKNGETTTASVGRICTERSVGINVDVNPFEPHILASNLAHAIGHNLGFGHDDMSGGSGRKSASQLIYLKTLQCFRRAKYLQLQWLARLHHEIERQRRRRNPAVQIFRVQLQTVPALDGTGFSALFVEQTVGTRSVRNLRQWSHRWQWRLWLWIGGRFTLLTPAKKFHGYQSEKSILQWVWCLDSRLG